MSASASPQAPARSIVTHGHARFTVLADRFIRMEWAADGVFEDRATFAAANRLTPKVRFAAAVKGATLTLRTDALNLTYVENGRPFDKTNLRATFKHRGRDATWRFGMPDRGNLGGTFKTLDAMDGGCKRAWVKFEDRDPDKPILATNGGKTHVHQGDLEAVPLGPGLLSRDGWVVFDDSKNVVLEPALCDWQAWPCERPAGVRQDCYLLAYGHDYLEALRDAARVFGAQPLPPRYALGYWFSRYWAYTDKEIEQLVEEFDRHNVPLDVMVIDMDWHKMGWTGYTWDPDFFPDYREFLQWLKRRDLKITLNLHPAEGVFSYEEAYPAMCEAMRLDPEQLPPIEPPRIPLYKMLGLDPAAGRRIPLDVCDPNYMQAYFKCLHHPYEKDGVDFWWMDWQQGRQGSALPNLDTLPWINELHWQDQVRNHPTRRPLNFSRFGGLGAGRMPVGFSGDTMVTWRSLAFQPEFTSTAANVLYGYWSHDIGGHMGGAPCPELYARWLQFGLFSPVLRTHTTKDARNERRVFHFPDPFRSVMVDALRRRYALLPYIYTELRETCDSGVSLCRPMYYAHPESPAAYRARDQYYFGRELLVAPVIQPMNPKDEMAAVKVWLPEGDWFDVATGELLRGGRTLTRRYLLSEVPVFARPGAVIPEQTPPTRVRPGCYDDLVFTIYPGAEQGAYTLYEDDGVTQAYREGEAVRLTVSHRKLKTGRRIGLGKCKGGFAGYRARRPVTIRLAGAVPPAAVRVGNRTLRWSCRPAKTGWRYDGDTATTIITLAEVNLARGATITVVDRKDVPASAAYGLKGLLARLERVREYNCLVSPPNPIHGEERLAVHAAQTGNRIGRDPARFAAERAELVATLARLPVVLKEYQAAHRARSGAGGAPVLALQQARNLLAATQRQAFLAD